MSSQRGVVDHVNWRSGVDGGTHDGTVTVELIPEGVRVDAQILGNWPPPPRSLVRIDQVQGGGWIVKGVEGGRRLLVHDDFGALNVSTGGDTRWTPSSTAGRGTIAAVSADRPGVMRMRSGAQMFDATLVVKSGQASASPGVATYTAYCVQLPSVTQVSADLSQIAPAFSGGFWQFRYDSSVSANWRVSMADASTVTIDTGITVVAGQWYLLELIMVPNMFCAAYIDGLGPFYTPAETFKDATANAYSMSMQVLNGVAAAKDLYVDLARMEMLGTLLVPVQAQAGSLLDGSQVQASSTSATAGAEIVPVGFYDVDRSDPFTE